MATYIAQDRRGIVAELTDQWAELLPITAREAKLLRAVRSLEDLQDANTDNDAESKVATARIVALNMVEGW